MTDTTTPKIRCPQCSGTRFSVCVSTLATVNYDDDGEHYVTDTHGDIEFDENSQAVCGCGWSGQLKELV